MKLAFIGTGKIIADALFAIEPIKEIEKTAIFARPHSKEKAEAFSKNSIISLKFILTIEKTTYRNRSRYGLYRSY